MITIMDQFASWDDVFKIVIILLAVASIADSGTKN